MKRMKIVMICMTLLFLAACAVKEKFPISTVTPAAVITVKMKPDKNGNYQIEITAKNLASAERLSPSENNYVVWAVTENNGTKNLGRFKNKNAEKLFFSASTPFTVKEIFITAEEQGDISNPTGVEISRLNISPKNK